MGDNPASSTASKRKKTWASHFMALFGAPNSERLREMPDDQRRWLHAYFFWIKYQFVLTLYRQHSMAYNLIRHPPRLRFWLRALSPLTPLFGGIKITESNTRYTLFCNMIAVGKGAFYTLPVIFWGRHVLKRHPDGEFICDYLENDAYVPGHFIVPNKYNAKYKEQRRAAKYEYYLRRGLPIPPEYMPNEDLLEKRRLYNEIVARRNVGDPRTSSSEPQFNITMSAPVKGNGLGARQGKAPSPDKRPSTPSSEEEEPKESSWRNWFKW